ncbi:hypothetical protein BJ944DRAFT_270305 [Cunninghamella echinulata]|nr:hypothetical protein BJ944DRAFT_270305 [Cunninghamella echinulata]
MSTRRTATIQPRPTKASMLRSSSVNVNSNKTPDKSTTKIGTTNERSSTVTTTTTTTTATTTTKTASSINSKARASEGVRQFMAAQRSRLQKTNKDQDDAPKPRSSTVMTGAQRYTDKNDSSNNHFDSSHTSPNKGLANLKGVIQKAKSTGKINISNRELDHIPEQIVTMYHVDPNSIVIDFNSSGDAWYDAVELSKFVASDNKIKVVDDRLGKEFGALTILDFRNNLLQSLPSTLTLLKQLTVLQLSLNRFENIPDVIFEIANLRELNMSKNQITVIPDTIGNLQHLEIVDFSENQIGSEVPSTMAQLSNLRKLDFSHNKLNAFSLIILSKWPLIQDLNFAHNRLTQFQQDSNEPIRLPSLARLDLRSNNLQNLTWDIQLPKLKELFLSGNKLISEENHSPESNVNYGFLQHCSELQTLDVSFNQWNTLPNSTITLESLQRLDMRGNQFKQLPNDLGKLPNLKVLLWEGNPIRSAPRNISMDKLIESLRVASLQSADTPIYNEDNDEEDQVVDFNKYEPKTNDIRSRELPSENTKLDVEPTTKSTRLLDLSNKKLNEVTDSELSQYNDVQTLQLHHNNIPKFPSFTNLCETLVQLYLEHNKIESFELGTSFSSSIVFPHLKVLNLNNNRMKYLTWQEDRSSSSSSSSSSSAGSSDTIKFPKLVELNICHNQLSQLPSGLATRILPSLTILRVSNNRLASLDPESLGTIQVLDIANNDLVSLPSGLGLIPSLQDIAVHGNRFRVPQPSIVAQGSSAVMAFLRRRAGVSTD